MTKLRILVTRRMPPTVEAHLARHHDVTIIPGSERPDADTLRAAMRSYDVLVSTLSDRINTDILDTPNRRVKLIANFGVGYDNIDTHAAARAGIAVTNTPDVLTDATADIAMLLILMILRRASVSERTLRAGQWRGWRPNDVLGRDVGGKKLGIVGFGRIGQATARRGYRGFGMDIGYHSRRRVDEGTEAAFDATYFASLDDMMGWADIISLHCPGTAETHHLIDARRLSLMRRDAYLVNTARGSVVDEQALIAALQEERIAGAGLDVYEAEPHVPEALIALDNVSLLPHLGSATVETRNAMGMRVAENIAAFAEGRPCPDRVA